LLVCQKGGVGVNNLSRENDLLAELREILAETIDIDAEVMGYDTHFINDLGVDSLLSLEVMVALEKKYKIKLSEQELQQMYSLRKVYELVSSRVDPDSAIARDT
jgi:acyl carrier protein